jgi:hypothetical protein
MAASADMAESESFHFVVYHGNDFDAVGVDVLEKRIAPQKNSRFLLDITKILYFCIVFITEIKSYELKHGTINDINKQIGTDERKEII